MKNYLVNIDFFIANTNIGINLPLEYLLVSAAILVSLLFVYVIFF